MEYDFPSYQDLFEQTKRRLNNLKELAMKKNGRVEDEDKFMFMIVGNINLRFNTICLLLNNGNYDGIFALQRTLFELQLVFEAYMNSENKKHFLELYYKKSNFETAIKWQKLIEKSIEEKSNTFTKKDKENIDEWKIKIEEDLKETTKERTTKTWYELATGEKIIDLSYKYLSATDYFISYDEPSNWVHPQRMEENLDVEFNQLINLNSMFFLVNILKSDIKWIAEDIQKIKEYVKLDKSPRFQKYFISLMTFDNRLGEIGQQLIGKEDK